MKTTIKIECESIGELKSHLCLVLENVIIKATQIGLDNDDTFTQRHELSDNNCHGTQEVVIDEKFDSDGELFNGFKQLVNTLNTLEADGIIASWSARQKMESLLKKYQDASL